MSAAGDYDRLLSAVASLQARVKQLEQDAGYPVDDDEEQVSCFRPVREPRCAARHRLHGLAVTARTYPPQD